MKLALKIIKKEIQIPNTDTHIPLLVLILLEKGFTIRNNASSSSSSSMPPFLSLSLPTYYSSETMG